MGRTGIVALLAACMLLTGVSRPVLGYSREVIDACHVSGTFLGCDASGAVRHPADLHLRFSSRPRFNWRVHWSVVCFKGTQQARRARTFYSHERDLELVLPMGYQRPRRCEVAASVEGGFAEGGGANLTLWAHVR